MTEPTNETTDPAAAEDAAEQTAGADDAADVAALRKEAASYRTKLRGAESELRTLQAERDVLAERLAAEQRREVERLATEIGTGNGMRTLASGDDLWTSAELPDLLDEAGAVDPAKVAEATRLLLERRPHYARRLPGLNGGVRIPPPSEPTLGDVLGNVGRQR